MTRHKDLIDLDKILPGLSFSDKSAESEFMRTLSTYFPANFVLPANQEIEKTVIGTIVSTKASVAITFPIIRADDFHHPTCRRVYEICSNLYRSGENIDIIIVTEKYRETFGESVGHFLVDCSNRIASNEHLESHCRLMKDYSMKRSIIQIGLSAIKAGLDDKTSGSETFGMAQNWLMDAVSTGTSNITIHEPGNVALEMFKGLDKALQEKSKITGYRTGISCIDNHFGGLQPTDLIILAARPGMGKTSCMLSMFYDPENPVKEPVLIFSLEMTAISLFAKIAAFQTGISVNRLIKKTVTEDELRLLSEHLMTIENSNIHIVDASGLSIEMMMIIARLAVHTLGIKAIGVDYIGLSTTDNKEKRGNQTVEIGAISKGLKSMAKTLNVPVVALSQLSRAVETRGGSKIPILSDLRDSGNIEQDADIVAFLFRPEYYGIKEWAKEGTDGLALFVIAKYRNGSLDTFKLHFDKNTTRFSDTWGLFNWSSAKAKILKIENRDEPDPAADDEDVPF